MSTTDFNRPRTPEYPGAIGEGADIYRKLDRRPRRARWLGAVPFVVAAVLIAGAGVAAYVVTTPAASPKPTPPLAAEQAVPAIPPAAPAAPPAPVAINTSPTSQRLVVAPQPVVHRPEHSQVAAQAAHLRPRHAAQSAVSKGEDANAYTPYTPPAQPAPSTMTPPPVASTPPAPVNLPPPPAPPANGAAQPQS